MFQLSFIQFWPHRPEAKQRAVSPNRGLTQYFFYFEAICICCPPLLSRFQDLYATHLVTTNHYLQSLNQISPQKENCLKTSLSHFLRCVDQILKWPLILPIPIPPVNKIHSFSYSTRFFPSLKLDHRLQIWRTKSNLPFLECLSPPILQLRSREKEWSVSPAAPVVVVRQIARRGLP